MIEVRGLVKRYGGHTAVDGIDLDVQAGEVVAILGPNGAGKTTTVEILEGHRARTSGTVRVLGSDPVDGGRAFRERIGIVLQSTAIPKEFTPRELVTLFAGMYPAPRNVDEVLQVVGLTEKSDERVKTLSGGQQRRVDLALGLIGDPEVLFLDEPTTGFDPSARRRSWKIVQNLAALGKTIVLTTHYMDEAQALADRVIVMARGRIVAQGTPSDLVDLVTIATVVRFRLPDGVAFRDVPEVPGSTPADRGIDGELVSVRTNAPTATVHALTGWAVERGLELDRLEVVRPGLEDVYLRLVGEDALEDGLDDVEEFAS